MPLLDSGTALFAGTAREFVRMAPASSLTAHLVKEFSRRYGGVAESEQRAWRNSLTAFAHVVDTSGSADLGVGVELKLPWNSRRIDASLVGRDLRQKPNVVLVELKQWISAAATDIPEMVLLGSARRLHPSAQAALYADYLRDSHSAFTEHGFGLSACSYLHNLDPESAVELRSDVYEDVLQSAPFFAAGDERALATMLERELGGGGGVELLPRLVNGGFSPSKRLLDGIAQSLDQSPAWVLIDEQREAFNLIRALAERSAKIADKAVVIVTGGPGTGKSVIAANLLVALSSKQLRVVHATGSKAFTTNLRAVGGRSSSSLFRYFNSFPHKGTPRDGLDVLLCDEAHRIRETSNSQYTPKAKRSEISQVRELIKAARVTVFFLDEHQNVRPGEIGTVSAIEEGASIENVSVERVALDEQFRCNGCRAYVDWVDSLFTDRPEPAGPWMRTEYAVSVFESPAEMENEIKRALGRGQTARIVAGFCWPWSDPLADGSLPPDVTIAEWRRPWNEKSPEQQRTRGSEPAPSRHPYYHWATSSDHAEEIGCIYSAQGFEFEYCGVILGDDLVWRSNLGWVANKKASCDSAITRRRLSDSQLRDLLRHTYRVLLTRGMRGTFIYSTDAETRQKLRELLSTE